MCRFCSREQGEQKAKYHDVCDKCVRQPTCQSDCFLQQGEQKPAAWSEDDYLKMSRLYSIIGQAASEHAFMTTKRIIGDKECIDLQNWLKSLIPQNRWKPSGEQMEGLECTIKTLKYQLNVGDNRLNSLYNDLKKLRED